MPNRWMVLLGGLGLVIALASVVLGAGQTTTETEPPSHMFQPLSPSDVKTLWDAATELSLKVGLVKAVQKHVSFTLEVDNSLEKEHLAARFDPKTKTIYIISRVMQDVPTRSYILIHELTHYIMDAQGIPLEKHHCAMSKAGYATRVISYMNESGTWGQLGGRFARAAAKDEERYAVGCQDA